MASQKQNITFHTIEHEGEAPQHIVIENQTGIDEHLIHSEAQKWFNNSNDENRNFVVKSLASRPSHYGHVLKIWKSENQYIKLELVDRKERPDGFEIESNLRMLNSAMDNLAANLVSVCSGTSITCLKDHAASHTFNQPEVRDPVVTPGRLPPIIATGLRGPDAIMLCIKLWYKNSNGYDLHLKPFGAHAYSHLFNGNRIAPTMTNDIECLITELFEEGAQELQVTPLLNKCYMLEIRHGGRFGVQMKRREHLFELRGRSRDRFVKLDVIISKFHRSSGRLRATGGDQTDTVHSWHPVDRDGNLLPAQWKPGRLGDSKL